jgi:hypothetical protein
MSASPDALKLIDVVEYSLRSRSADASQGLVALNELRERLDA